MAYFEYLRVRRNFVGFAMFVFAIAAVVNVISALHSGDIQVSVGEKLHGFSVVFFTSLAAWGTAILATIIAASLNQQRDHLSYTWTRPQGRSSLALGLIAVDVGFLIAGFVLVLLIAMVTFTTVVGGRVPIVWAHAAPALLRGFGLTLMWYALVQAATAWGTFRGVTIAALSWPIFIILAALEAARFPAPWHQLLTVINLFNPMAYISGTTVQNNGEVVLHSIIPLGDTARLLFMYVISSAALIFAVFSWKRMEA